MLPSNIFATSLHNFQKDPLQCFIGNPIVPIDTRTLAKTFSQCDRVTYWGSYRNANKRLPRTVSFFPVKTIFAICCIIQLSLYSYNIISDNVSTFGHIDLISAVSMILIIPKFQRCRIMVARGLCYDIFSVTVLWHRVYVTPVTFLQLRNNAVKIYPCDIFNDDIEEYCFEYDTKRRWHQKAASQLFGKIEECGKCHLL